MEALRHARIGGEIGFAGLALMAGAAFGAAAAAAAPEVGAGAAAYSVVGMAAVAAAVLGAPISTAPIVFELTGKHNVAVAVMIAVAASALACRRAVGASWFALQLAERAAAARRRA